VVVSAAGLGIPLGAEIEVSSAYVTVGR